MSAEAFREAITEPHKRVIVALDGMNWGQAEEVVSEVGEYVGMAKANAIAQKGGWDHAVRTIGDLGALTMADQKYKDIPKTMRNHLQEITECGPALITVFADNDPSALVAAVEGRDKGKKNFIESEVAPHKRGKIEGVFGGILGVTVLTSIKDEACVSIYGDKPIPKVLQFAHFALEAGLDGIVCSAEELEAVRADSDLDKLLTVVPGIVPAWVPKPKDQERVATPANAIQGGADFIVVGRAITQPPEGISRSEAAQRIAQEIEETL